MGLDAKLVEKAKTLGLNHEEFKDDDSLSKAIADKEKKDDDTEINDLETAKKEIKKFKEEAKKAFDARDEAKRDRKKLQSEIDSVKEQMKGAPSKEEFDALSKQLGDLKKFKEDQDKKLEEDELKNKSELEKQKIRFDKEFERLKKDMEDATGKIQTTVAEKEKILKEKDTQIERLRRDRLKSEIMEQASKLKAYNPFQVARLIMDEFTYDDGVDRFFFYKKDSKGKVTSELEVEERVKEFLSDAENDNLVESSSKGGTGHQTDQGKGKKIEDSGGGKDTDKKYDPKDPELIKVAERKGLSVEDHITILKQRDAKFDKIKGKK